MKNLLPKFYQGSKFEENIGQDETWSDRQVILFLLCCLFLSRYVYLFR
jgi:hypothetical protein